MELGWGGGGGERRRLEEREGMAHTGQAFGTDRQVACGSSQNHPPKHPCKSGNDWEAAVWAGMFHVWGSQG